MCGDWPHYQLYTINLFIFAPPAAMKQINPVPLIMMLGLILLILYYLSGIR